MEKPKNSEASAADGAGEQIERFGVEFKLEDLTNLCLRDIAKNHSNGAAVMTKVEDVIDSHVDSLQEQLETNESKG